MKRNGSHNCTNSLHTYGHTRRDLLEMGAGAAAVGLLGWPQPAAAQQAPAWNEGQLVHLIPTANHERILIKASFKSPLASTPQLPIGGKSVDGVKTDT